jgi:uncharacterized lipoprotein YajG
LTKRRESPIRGSVAPTIRRRLTAGCAAACASALIAGCGTQTPTSPPPSSNPLPAAAANTTNAPAYGADIRAAQALGGVLQQSAQRDVGGATGP